MEEQKLFAQSSQRAWNSQRCARLHWTIAMLFHANLTNKAFFSEASIEEKVKALRQACNRHVSLTKECSKGLGQDRFVPSVSYIICSDIEHDIGTFMHCIACISVSLVEILIHFLMILFPAKCRRHLSLRFLQILAGIFSAHLYYRLRTVEILHSDYLVLVQSLQMGMVLDTSSRRMV